MNTLIISSSPHIRSSLSSSLIMTHVIIALLPASVAGIVLFGWMSTLPIIAISILTAVFSEALLQKILGIKLSIKDGSAALTGLLLALTLAPTVPLWVVCIGSFTAILSKQLFGGMGQNIFNPALIGRAFIVISWPVQNAQWISPSAYGQSITTATPLQVWSSGGMGTLIDQFGGHAASLYRNLFFGHHGGCIGEVYIPAIILGLAYLLAVKVVSWRIPLTYALTVVLISLLLNMDPLVSLLTGGLLFGAFFMATDYATSPLLPSNQIIFGVGAGLINMIIRAFTPMPEGVTFAILIMNMLVPLMDRKIKKPVGWLPEKRSGS